MMTTLYKALKSDQLRLAPSRRRQRDGDTVEVAIAGLPASPLQIAGFYNPADVGTMGGTWAVLIVAREATPKTETGGVLRVVAAAASERLAEATNAVGGALPL